MSVCVFAECLMPHRDMTYTYLPSQKSMSVSAIYLHALVVVSMYRLNMCATLKANRIAKQFARFYTIKMSFGIISEISFSNKKNFPFHCRFLSYTNVWRYRMRLSLFNRVWRKKMPTDTAHYHISCCKSFIYMCH